MYLKSIYVFLKTHMEIGSILAVFLFIIISDCNRHRLSFQSSRRISFVEGPLARLDRHSDKIDF